MNLLLDTHVLLWWLDDNPSLSKKARMSISDGANSVFVSAAVVWEIEIKKALGKLKIPADFRQVLLFEDINRGDQAIFNHRSQGQEFILQFFQIVIKRFARHKLL